MPKAARSGFRAVARANAPSRNALPPRPLARFLACSRSVLKCHRVVASLEQHPTHSRILPKMVEFTQYNGLPHLLIPEVITNKDMTINALDWAIKEMDRRYAMFAKNRVVNINEFNRSEIVKSGKEQKIPFIVIVVDELADLMLEAKREIDDRINKLAAKARAIRI